MCFHHQTIYKCCLCDNTIRKVDETKACAYVLSKRGKVRIGACCGQVRYNYQKPTYDDTEMCSGCRAASSKMIKSEKAEATVSGAGSAGSAGRDRVQKRRCSSKRERHQKFMRMCRRTWDMSNA